MLEDIAARITGNDSILSSDYEMPISVEFGEGSEVLEAEVTDVSPKDLQPTVVIRTPTKVSLEPLLLNKGDSIALKILLADCDGTANVTGRIVGVKKILVSSTDQMLVQSIGPSVRAVHYVSVLSGLTAGMSIASMIRYWGIPLAVLLAGAFLLSATALLMTAIAEMRVLRNSVGDRW